MIVHHNRGVMYSGTTVSFSVRNDIYNFNYTDGQPDDAIIITLIGEHATNIEFIVADERLDAVLAITKTGVWTIHANTPMDSSVIFTAWEDIFNQKSEED